MDWNWFFSALSQSFAAIVGLIGAFLATKILNNEASFKKRKASAETNLIKTLNLEGFFHGKKKELQSLLEKDGYGGDSLIPHKIQFLEIMKNFELQMDLNRSLLYEMKTNPEYSRLNSLIVWLLFFLSIFGVVIPLFFIPISEHPNLCILMDNIKSVRSVFVILPFLIFSTFLFFIHGTHENLKHSKYEKDINLMKTLELYSNFSEYEKK